MQQHTKRLDFLLPTLKSWEFTERVYLKSLLLETTNGTLTWISILAKTHGIEYTKHVCIQFMTAILLGYLHKDNNNIPINTLLKSGKSYIIFLFFYL